MKEKPYIEPTIRTIAGALLVILAAVAITRPDLKIFWWSFLVFIGANLFQSGLTRFCLLEKILKRAGFRSEMDEIRDLALQDGLTKLPNRVLLEDRVAQAIVQAKRNNNKVAMLFIDLDNFKQINDIQGHKAGDQLLIEVSRALQEKMRPYDTLARWGGDEFVVLLPDLQYSADARAVAEKLMKSVNDRLESSQNLNTTLSIGIAAYPDDADTTEKLFMQADKALFHSKAQGRNNYQIFSEMQESGKGFVDSELTMRFTAALKTQLLQVHFQPIVDAVTHQPVCVEALARWYDKKSGWISPGLFIPLAENLGLIEEMGNQILLEAVTHFAACPWQDQMQLAVNISHRQLFSRSFVSSVMHLIGELEVDPHRIKFEITESSALDTDRAQHTLQQLSDLGFTISVDDFGTGFSSLSRLHEMPVKELKIDLSFVQRIKTHKGRLMLNTIINMGKAMNLTLVAEGVEDKETADVLRDMGVHYLQGYYFCRPKPDAELREYILKTQTDSHNLVSITSKLKGHA
ncbi:MAG TPA: EAL domain-containing protein [Gammaproteobacteria bacterium]